MKNYIVYNEQGKILRTGICLDDYFEQQATSDENIIEGIANANLNYISNGLIVNFPEKPIGTYYFDYTTKQWVFDTEKAIVDANVMRDILLRDGPDRISPVWWSSMTAEEQQAWTDYRQALLDITSQPNYPQEIIWPTKP